MRQNPKRLGFHRQPLVSNIPGSFTWILVSVFAAGGVVAVPISELRRTALTKAGQRPANVETLIQAQGYDGRHRSLPFTVYVLTQQLSWKLESADDLEGQQTMLSPALILAINEGRDVFCVGTASFEGLTRTEEGRAAQRAAKLSLWVSAVIRNLGHPRLFTLNAGQYLGPPELVSSSQRKAIILVTGPHDDDVNLSEGLASGLERQEQASPVIYALLHQYSRSKEWLNLAPVPR